MTRVVVQGNCSIEDNSREFGLNPVVAFTVRTCSVELGFTSSFVFFIYFFVFLRGNDGSLAEVLLLGGEQEVGVVEVGAAGQ